MEVSAYDAIADWYDAWLGSASLAEDAVFVLWRLATTRGTSAIKEVGRELSLDPEATLALELAAHAGGIATPPPSSDAQR